MRSFSVRRNLVAIFGVLVFILIRTPCANAYRYTLIPTLTVMEEFNDNIHESRTDRQADLVTHIVPGISFNYSTPLWDWNVSYNPEYRNYARGTSADQFLQNLAGTGNIRLIDNFLFLSISDIYSQAPIDGNRDSLYINQNDQNIFTVSPYIRYQLNPRWTALAGYRYVNRSYSNSGSISNQEQGVFFRVTRELTPKCSVFMNVDADHVSASDNTAHERLTHTVGIQYQYAGGSSVSAQAGYSLYFPDTGNSLLLPYWGLGLIQEWKAFTFSLNSGVAYDTDQTQNASERTYVTGRLTQTYSRGLLGITGGYNNTRNNQTGITSSQWFTAGADASYDFTRRASAHAALSADKYLNDNAIYADQQYRNSFTAGLRYALYYDLFIGLDYNRIAYSDNFFSPVGPIEVNRIMAYLTKTFAGADMLRLFTY